VLSLTLAPSYVTPDEAPPSSRILVDGRNRLAACQLAGVEPVFVPYQGNDVVAFIISENAGRRHMTKGALAMVAAKAFPEQASRGRGLKSPLSGHFPGIPHQRVADARIVLRHAPDLADMVLVDTMSLKEAYEEARHRRGDFENRQEGFKRIAAEAPDLMELAAVDLKGALEQLDTRNAEAALLTTLELERDLVALVREKRLPLKDALAAKAERDTVRRNLRQGATRLLYDVVRSIGADIDPKERGAHLADNLDPVFWPPEHAEQMTSKYIRHCAVVLAVAADCLKAKG
jgi:hypothetical protein